MDNQDTYDSFDNLLTSNMDFASLTDSNINKVTNKIVKAKEKGQDDKFVIGAKGRNALNKPVVIDVQKDSKEDIRSKLSNARRDVKAPLSVQRQLGPVHRHKRNVKLAVAGTAAVAIPTAVWGGMRIAHTINPAKYPTLGQAWKTINQNIVNSPIATKSRAWANSAQQAIRQNTTNSLNSVKNWANSTQQTIKQNAAKTLNNIKNAAINAESKLTVPGAVGIGAGAGAALGAGTVGTGMYIRNKRNRE